MSFEPRKRGDDANVAVIVPRIYHVPLTLRRMDLLASMGENHALGRLSFSLIALRLVVSVLGFDRLGILKYLTSKFLKYDVRIASCFGQRLLSCQGSYFEITADQEWTLQRMADEFMTDDLVFEGDERRVPQKYADLTLLLTRMERDTLHRVARVLAEVNKINLARFLADDFQNFLFNNAFPDSRDDALKLAKRTTPKDADPYAYWTDVIQARLEVPEGVQRETLEQELLDQCPQGARCLIREHRPGMWVPEN